MASTAFMLEESDLKLNTARRFQRSEFLYNPDKLERVGGGDCFRLHYILKTNQDNLSRQADQICSVHWEGDWGWLTSGGGKFELYWSQ